MSKNTRAYYEWNKLLFKCQALYGEALTRLDQDGCDELLKAYQETRAIVGDHPNLSSETQMGHFRRLGHSLTVIQKVSAMNGLDLPPEFTPKPAAGTGAGTGAGKGPDIL